MKPQVKAMQKIIWTVRDKCMNVNRSSTKMHVNNTLTDTDSINFKQSVQVATIV
jgi:hypothetical protein